MARSKKVNKSNEIRRQLAAGVTSPKEVVANLAKRKIKVSAALVSQIKGRELNAEGHELVSVAEGRGLSSADVVAVLNLRKLISQYGAEQVKLVVDEVASLTA